jgi:hypothetical protein
MKRWEDERQRVPNLDDDVRGINEQLLLIVSDPAAGKRVLRLLQASAGVSRLIENTDASGIGTAIRCGIPLVSFAPAVNDLLCVEPNLWRPKSASEVPEKLQDLTLFVLMFAQKLAQIKAVMAQSFFKLTLSASENLAMLPVFHVNRLSRQFGLLLRLREGDQQPLWEDLFVGERAQGALAFQIAQEAAGLSLRGTQRSAGEGLRAPKGKIRRRRRGPHGNEDRWVDPESEDRGRDGGTDE